MKRRHFLLGTASLAFTAATRAAWPQEPESLLDRTQTGRLAEALRGRLILPGDTAYESARRVLAAKVDRRPALIVRAADADDVRRAVDFARENGLPIAVRSGGHSLAGHGTCDGGLLIDMADQKRVEPDAARGLVRVAGGAKTGDVDRATAPHRLAAVLGECPMVGVGGFALGGGEGFLMGRHGVACDNVTAADIVLADGQKLTASAESHPDLFWALRGGGGNFGVVTALEANLHPVGRVLGGFVRVIAPLASALRDFDAVMQMNPDLIAIARIYMSPEAPPAMRVRLCWLDEPERAAAALAPLLSSVDGGIDALQAMDYHAFQADGPAGAVPIFDVTRSGFLPEIGDEVIEEIRSHVEERACHAVVTLVRLGGAVGRAPAATSAFPLRSNGYDLWITAEWTAPEEAPVANAWVGRLWSRVGPRTRRAYVNGLEEEGPARVKQAYGPHYERLARIKRRYDPDNLFRFNANIVPA